MKVKKSARINFLVEPVIREGIERMAEANNMTISEYLRALSLHELTHNTELSGTPDNVTVTYKANPKWASWK